MKKDDHTAKLSRGDAVLTGGESVTTEGNVANLLGMARTAALGGNQQEALTYYNRVLEIDPTVADAWMGKGKAAGWQSSLVNIRLNESLIAFNHALANASDDAKTAITEESVDTINQIVVALYQLARDHLVGYASLDNTWSSYLNQVSQLIDALDQARILVPDNRTTLDNIVHLCKDNIEGYSFRDQFNNNAPAAHAISQHYESLLRQRMNQAIESIRAIDPSYAAPAIEKKTADACFVVTATMGDFNHPDVVLLRNFRDTWVRRRAWGNGFVNIYYKAGPFLAAIIQRSPSLRALSYRFIVRPAVHFARRRTP